MGSSLLLLASAVSSLGGLVFGYEFAIISGALLQLKAEFSLSCFQQEVLVGSLLVGALLASVAGGYVIDRHGRRKSILLSNVLILAGSLVLLLSSFPALVAGRALVGFAMSISSMSCCIFVSEIVAAERRGFLVTLYETGITVGILAAYATNYFLSDVRRGWRWMFGFAVAPTLIQLVAIWFLPSGASGSPRQRGSFQAEGNLMGAAEQEVASGGGEQGAGCSSWYLFQRRDNMRSRTLVGLGLVLFQQFTGQPSVLFYASTIFHSVGFRSDASALLASVGLGLVKVIATLTSTVFSDRVGRRPLLISGCGVMALCLVTIGVLSGHAVMDAGTPCHSAAVNGTDPPHAPTGNQSLFGLHLRHEDAAPGGEGGQKLLATPPPHAHGTAANWIVLLSLMGVISAYSVGFGPMTWLILSEIFPAAIRGRAFAFTSCFNWAANLLVSVTFLNVIDAIGVSGMFLLYGMSSVAAGVFFYFLLPETKGKTLEQIDEELRLNRFYHGERCCVRKASPRYQRVSCDFSPMG